MYQPSQVAAKRFGFCNPTSPTQGQWASKQAYKSHIPKLGFCNPTSPTQRQWASTHGYKSHIPKLGFCTNPTLPTQGQWASTHAYKSHIPKLRKACLARPFWLRSSVVICWDFLAFFKYFWVVISGYYRKYCDSFGNIVIISIISRYLDENQLDTY